MARSTYADTPVGVDAGSQARTRKEVWIAQAPAAPVSTGRRLGRHAEARRGGRSQVLSLPPLSELPAARPPTLEEPSVKTLGTAVFVKATTVATSVTTLVLVVGAGRKF